MSLCPSTFNFMHEILNRSKRQYKRHHQSGNKSHKLTYAIWPRHELLIIITFHITGTYHLGMSNKLITNLFKHSIIPVPNPCNSSTNFLLLKLAEEANKQASKAREWIQKEKKKHKPSTPRNEFKECQFCRQTCDKEWNCLLTRLVDEKRELCSLQFKDLKINICTSSFCVPVAVNSII